MMIVLQFLILMWLWEDSNTAFTFGIILTKSPSSVPLIPLQSLIIPPCFYSLCLWFLVYCSYISLQIYIFLCWLLSYIRQYRCTFALCLWYLNKNSQKSLCINSQVSSLFYIHALHRCMIAYLFTLLCIDISVASNILQLQIILQ